jgi:hypothetical protein
VLHRPVELAAFFGKVLRQRNDGSVDRRYGREFILISGYEYNGGEKSRANRKAVARPIPWLAPVTMATDLTVIMSFSSDLIAHGWPANAVLDDNNTRGSRFIFSTYLAQLPE